MESLATKQARVAEWLLVNGAGEAIGFFHLDDIDAAYARVLLPRDPTRRRYQDGNGTHYEAIHLPASAFQKK